MRRPFRAPANVMPICPPERVPVNPKKLLEQSHREGAQ
jgi:hypothetical protein